MFYSDRPIENLCLIMHNLSCLNKYTRQELWINRIVCLNLANVFMIHSGFLNRRRSLALAFCGQFDLNLHLIYM